MKQAFATVILFLAASLIFAAGGQEKSSRAGEAPAKAAVTLDTSSFQWGEPGYKVWWAEVTTAFAKDNPGVNVTGQTIPYNDYYDQMTVRLQAGNPPDIMLMGGSLHPFIMMGKFEPLDAYIKSSSGLLARYSPAKLAYASRDGKIYQLPYVTMTYGMFWNSGFFDEEGLAAPTTPEQFFETAKKLTKRSSDGSITQYGYAVTLPPALYHYYSDLLAWTEAFGGHFAKDGQVTVNTPAVREAVTFIKSVYDANVSPRRSNESESRQLFWQGKAAMIIDVVTIGGWVQAQNPSMLPKLGSSATPGGKGLVLPFGMVMAKDSKAKAEVWKFMEYAVQPKWAQRLVELILSPAGLDAPISPAISQANPWLKAHLDMAKVGVPVPPPGLEQHYERFRRVLIDSMGEILFNNKPIDATLQATQDELERQIKR